MPSTTHRSTTSATSRRPDTRAVLIDTQGPSGNPLDPGSVLVGTVALSDSSPSDAGAGVASVTFQYSPHGANTWTTIGTPVTTAPWSVAFDTTAVADGQYDLRELISDAAAPANVTRIDLTGPKVIDNSPPSSAAVTAPAPGAHVSGTVAVGGVASDATSGIGQMVFKVNGTIVGTSSGSPASVSWDSTSLPDGPVSVTVEAKDAAGNGPTVSPARSIVVDNDPPTVTLHNPGGAVRGTIALTTTASADATQVTFERSPAGAGTWTTIAVDNAAPFTASLDTTLLADAVYDLRAVASDGLHLATSSIVTTRVDNTAPSGAVTAPLAGATVGSSGTTLTAGAVDAGSGVATVEFRVDGTSIGSVSAAPWQLSWNASATASGSHTIDAVVSDAAGNSTTTAGVPITVDSTPPTVTLTDPGALLSGTVTLAATSPDPDTVDVAFQISPAGAGIWTTLSTDATAPVLPRASTRRRFPTVYSTCGRSRTTASATPPCPVSSARAGSTTPCRRSSLRPRRTDRRCTLASSISVTASEPLAAVTGLLLDGSGTGVPTISGSTATLATGPLADGPHTLAGSLVDLTGKTAPFTTHFTIVTGSPADWPYVEMNTFPGVTTTLTSSDGGASVTTRDTHTGSADHLVLRIDPEPPGVAGDFTSGLNVYDVTSYWSLTGIALHSFSAPLEIALSNPTGEPLVPATFENGAWRAIPAVPVVGSLPPSWSDGYFAGPGATHILTTHLSEFTLLHDRSPRRRRRATWSAWSLQTG